MKKEKGITLIALVVTIIILVILATVSIGMVLGKQGIFTQAEEAKKITANAQIAEEENFNKLYEQLSGYIDRKIPQINIDEKAKENSTINGEKGSYRNPIIPKGFKPINQEKAIWTEVNGYKEGLVIEDATSDTTTQGSQFVWVPVENYDNFCLREGYYKGSLQDRLSQESNPSREAGASKMEILPGKPNTANTVLGTDESVAMYKSVKENRRILYCSFRSRNRRNNYF